MPQRFARNLLPTHYTNHVIRYASYQPCDIPLQSHDITQKSCDIRPRDITSAIITGMPNYGIATRGDYYGKTCYMVYISGIVDITAIIMYTGVASVPTGIPTYVVLSLSPPLLYTSHQNHITSHHSYTNLFSF